MSARLNSLGPITGATFQGFKQALDDEKRPALTEVYEVQFQNGRMIWMIGQNDAGQIQFFWTPG
jgi:hypothetical protein